MAAFEFVMGATELEVSSSVSVDSIVAVTSRYYILFNGSGTSDQANNFQEGGYLASGCLLNEMRGSPWSGCAITRSMRCLFVRPSRVGSNGADVPTVDYHLHWDNNMFVLKEKATTTAHRGVRGSPTTYLPVASYHERKPQHSTQWPTRDIDIF